MAVKKKKKNKKKTLSPKEQVIAREKSFFKRKIRKIFEVAGFTYLATEGKEKFIAHRKIEIDMVFFFENIVLVCEDTIKTTEIKSHIQNKHEAFLGIQQEKKKYLECLYQDFPEITKELKEFNEKSIIICFLYFSKYDADLTDEDIVRFEPIKFIEAKTLEYFNEMSKTIKKTSRYEIFRFLSLSNENIGIKTNAIDMKDFQAPIIHPAEMTGLRNGVSMVSFMISAEFLLKTCFVARKDNWEQSMLLYQRLVEGKKIANVRKYLANNKRTFYNNIIVSLPNETKIKDCNGNTVDIGMIDSKKQYTLSIPNRMNSICIIDGQHRVFAYYEGLKDDSSEQAISKLRSQLHLLVTGLIFPETMQKRDRIQIESEIFLDINQNAKPIPPHLLLQIQMINEPISEQGLAWRVIERLNRSGCMKNMFALSTLDKEGIKVTSIIKYALRYLVSLDPAQGKACFINRWDGNIEELMLIDDEALTAYITFCAQELAAYFSAIKAAYSDYWMDPTSSILSVTSLNGFIIAFGTIFQRFGSKEREFYLDRLSNLDIDFSHDGFEFKSSQYHKFADKILSVFQ